MADDVQLTDLEVIQRYSLAVRGATAPREELVQTLRADLAWLTGLDPLSADEDVWDEPAPRPSPYRVAPPAQSSFTTTPQSPPKRDPARS